MIETSAIIDPFIFINLLFFIDWIKYLWTAEKNAGNDCQDAGRDEPEEHSTKDATEWGSQVPECVDRYTGKYLTYTKSQNV